MNGRFRNTPRKRRAENFLLSIKKTRNVVFFLFFLFSSPRFPFLLFRVTMVEKNISCKKSA